MKKEKGRRNNNDFDLRMQIYLEKSWIKEL